MVSAVSKMSFDWSKPASEALQVSPPRSGLSSGS